MASEETRAKPHCLRSDCEIEPLEGVCRHCGWWSKEDERRRELPLRMDPETGLKRKYVGRSNT